MSKYKLAGFCLLIVYCNSVCSQIENKLNVPTDLITKYYNKYAQSDIPTDAYKLELSLPQNYNRNGKIDYTLAIQNAINTHNIVRFPNFPILIKSGLKLKSNSSLYFQTNSKIIFDGQPMKKLDDILKVYDVNNVKIFNPKIKGSKNSGRLQKGEWSAGISILNSADVQVINPYIYETWGDGIFVGSENGKISTDITIKGGWIDQARRNGISVTSAVNLNISNVLISNTKGTAPQCGLEIEPSVFTNEIQNVNINNVTTYKNASSSFAINLGVFSSNKLQKTNKVSVNVDGLYDQGSNYFLGFIFNPKNLKYTVNSTIKVKNSKSLETRKSMWKDANKSNSKVILTNVTRQILNAKSIANMKY